MNSARGKQKGRQMAGFCVHRGIPPAGSFVRFVRRGFAVWLAHKNFPMPPMWLPARFYWSGFLWGTLENRFGSNHSWSFRVNGRWPQRSQRPRASECDRLTSVFFFYRCSRLCFLSLRARSRCSAHAHVETLERTVSHTVPQHALPRQMPHFFVACAVPAPEHEAEPHWNERSMPGLEH